MDLDLTKQAVSASTNYVYNKLDRVDYRVLQEYFDVDNSYVVCKTMLVLCPFYETKSHESSTPQFEYSQPSHTRNESEGSSSAMYKPDLYIPIMFIISLILFRLGSTGKFHPESLLLMLSRTIVINILTALFYKLSMYLSSVTTPYLSLLAFSGYKFVTILAVSLLDMMLPRFLMLPVSIYFLAAYFVFFSRCLKPAVNNLPKVTIVFALAGVETILSIYYIKF